MPADDTATDRPLLLFMHGGGFQSGQRDSEGIVKRSSPVTLFYTVPLRLPTNLKP